MSRRSLEFVGVAVVLVAVIGLLKLVPTPAVGVAVEAQAPRTLWGAPDLQGIWTDQFDTPLERSAQYANADVFTDEERAELDKQRVALPRRDAREGRGTERDVRARTTQCSSR